jgi:transcription initiation factor IIE alpha subunit
VEIIAKFKSRKKIKSFDEDIQKQILEAIKRRPLTDEDLSNMLSMHINEVNKYLSELLKNNIITTSRSQRGIFFKLNDNN